MILRVRQGMQGMLTEMMNGTVTGFITIPSVIFFPGINFLGVRALTIITLYFLANSSRLTSLRASQTRTDRSCVAANC